MKFLHLYVVSLISLTLVLLLSYDSLMNKRIIIDPSSGHEIQAGSDQVAHHGTSTFQLNQTNTNFTLDCQLDDQGYQWPFCYINFALGSANNGLDLSIYDAVRVKAKLTGPSKTLRIFLVSAVSKTSAELGIANRKYHEVEFMPSNFNNDVEIPLALFRTSQWWLNEYSRNILDTGVQLDNVVLLQISSGTDSVNGSYGIEIEKIELIGKLISRSNLYLFIIIFWGLSAMALSLLQIRATKKKLSASIVKATQLQQINDALHLQSKTYQQASIRDPLTGLYNRAALRDQAQEWLAKANEQGEKLSIVLFDVDHFKSVNDNHGHEIGDKVLIQVATLCKQQVRQQDMIVRWGGEEFAIFCPQTELQSAEMMANKIREYIQADEWPAQLNITASFGVSELYAGEPFTDFINRADQALYFSKENGRNMVSVTGFD